MGDTEYTEQQLRTQALHLAIEYAQGTSATSSDIVSNAVRFLEFIKGASALPPIE